MINITFRDHEDQNHYMVTSLDSTAEDLYQKISNKLQLGEEMESTLGLHYSVKRIEKGKIRDFGIQNGVTIILLGKDGVLGENIC